MKFNLEEKKKRKQKNGLSITPFITQKKDAGDVEKGIENFNALMSTGSPIGPAASGGMGESLGEKEMTEKFKDSYEYNDLDNLIGMIKVNAPESREEEKPEAKECMINETNIPDNMRFKDWDIDAIGDDVIQLYWTTQEPFTSEDSEKFIAEIKRFFEALIKRENFKKPFTVALEVMCRSLDEDDGHLVYDLEFNKEEINEGMDEGKKYLLIYNYGGNEEGTETSSYDSLEEAKQALKHKYEAIRRLYRESNSAGIDEDETYITDNLMYAHVQEHDNPSYTNIQWDELIIESPTAESKLNSNNNEEELKENKMDILNEVKLNDHDDKWYDKFKSDDLLPIVGNDKEAADIVYGWYDAEGAFESFDNKEDYLEFIEADIEDMMDAATNQQEIEIVKKALTTKSKSPKLSRSESKVNAKDYSGLILYRIYDYDYEYNSEVKLILTCNINEVKKYLEDNINHHIAVYQNKFERIYDLPVIDCSKDFGTKHFIYMDGWYDFPDIGKGIKKQLISDNNIDIIISQLEVCKELSKKPIYYFLLKTNLNIYVIDDEESGKIEVQRKFKAGKAAIYAASSHGEEIKAIVRTSYDESFDKFSYSIEKGFDEISDYSATDIHQINILNEGKTENKIEFKHLHEVMKEEKINPDDYDFKSASIYDKPVPEGTVLYKLFNFDDNHKFLTCDTDAVKAYLNDNIGKTISLYQNTFELKPEKFDYILGHNVAFKKTGESIITEGYYNFPDIGKRFEKIKLNNINIKTIINSLEESVSKDIDNLAHFAVKAYIDVKKVADNGIYCYTTAPFRNLLKYSTESNGKNILITSRWSLDRLDKEAIKAELKQINVDVKISNMQKLQEDLNNVTEVEDKAKEVMDPAFASAVRSIRSHDKRRAEARKLRKAPKEGEESLPKDIKMNLDESLFTEWVDDYDDYEIDRLYHDASEDELRAMGAFDNLGVNEDGEGVSDKIFTFEVHYKDGSYKNISVKSSNYHEAIKKIMADKNIDWVADELDEDIEILNRVKSPVSDDVELSADMKLRDAYTAYEPEEFQLDRLRNDITLKEVWEKMKAGEDIYELASVDGKGFDSAVREGIFVMLEMVLGIDYDTIYNTWLNN